MLPGGLILRQDARGGTIGPLWWSPAHQRSDLFWDRPRGKTARDLHLIWSLLNQGSPIEIKISCARGGWRKTELLYPTRVHPFPFYTLPRLFQGKLPYLLDSGNWTAAETSSGQNLVLKVGENRVMKQPAVWGLGCTVDTHSLRVSQHFIYTLWGEYNIYTSWKRRGKYTFVLRRERNASLFEADPLKL